MPSNLDIDAVFSEIGELGPQQVKYSIGFFLLNAFGAWLMLQYTFVGYERPFRCETKDQDTPYYNECPGNLVSSCSRLYFVDEDETTVVTEWTLVCDRAWLGPLTMSTFMAGVMTGALFLGGLADAIGRRSTITLCLASMVFLNGLAAAAPKFYLYAGLKFATGFFTGGYIIASFVLCNELIGASKRGLVSNGLQSFFAIGIVLYSLTAYYCRHWRYLTMFTTLVGSPLLLLHFYFPESPRWLHSKGRTKEALTVLRRIAVLNGKKMRSFSNDQESGRKDDSYESHKMGESRDSIWALFTHMIFLVPTIIQIYSWFVNSATYYGLTLAASASEKGESGDRYMQTAMSGIVEIPAYVLTHLLLVNFGRKLSLCGFMISGGIALLGIIIASDFPGIVNALALFGKLCIAASFSVAYIHSSEIFSTSIRNSAMGVVAVAARVGGILSPFLASLGQVQANLHLVVFGVLTFSSGLLNLRLPETSGKPLPESLADMRKLISSSSGSSPVKKQEANYAYEKLTTNDV